MTKYILRGFIFSSVIYLSVSQLYILTPLAPLSKEDIGISFYLHTLEEPNVDTNYVISASNLAGLRASPFDPKKKTKFIVHGFRDNGKVQWLKDMAAALLKDGDYNVIRVDWGGGSLFIPDRVLANTKVVGEVIANFINTIKDELNFNPADGHCIGHSMGSFVCGYAGRGVNKLGRITSLDVAPPVNEVEENETLDPSDANFVDVIHTNIKTLEVVPLIGDATPHGHIDIYINGGYYQPVCSNILKSLLDPLTIFSTIDPVCSHEIVYVYYIESISKACQWVAYECPSYEQFQKGECATCGLNNSKCAFVGLRAEEYPDKSRENVVLFINTAGEPPFCIQHYLVSISTGFAVLPESPYGGSIIFEVIGSTGRFTDQLYIKASEHGTTIKSLFISNANIGNISSVKLTWKRNIILPLFNFYDLKVYFVKVSPLTYYPERVRAAQEVVACQTSGGSPTTVNNGETEEFPVMTSCTI